MLRNFLVTFTVLWHLISMSHADECSCNCRGRRYQSVCDSVDDLWKIADTNTGKLMEWERYRPFVERFSDRWKKEISDIVDQKISEYMSERTFLPKPELLVRASENEIEDDSISNTKPSDDGSDLVHNLLAKVEMVENRTIEVEEVLKSERRVRRHLEQEMKETQSSLVYLGDKINATVPGDAILDQVQMVIHSSLEDMNKTLYEDHLKKLYYKVDGVAYKNETKDLIERLEHVEVELRDSDNISIVYKLADDLNTIKENFFHLNSSIGSILFPLVEALNNSIEGILVPKIEMLEVEAIRKDTVEELEENMKSLLNNTELLFKSALIDVWSDVKDIQRFEATFQNFSEEWSKSLETLQNQIEYLKNETILYKPVQLLEDNDVENEIFIVRKNKSEDENTTKGIEDYPYFEPEIVPKVVNRSRNLEEESSPDVVGRITVEEVAGQNNELCSEKPVINDPHLLVDVVKDSNGRNSLKFGCRPIGLYVVSHLPIPPRCEKGFWKEPFPSCKMLSTQNEIEHLVDQLKKEHPCHVNSSNGEYHYPDPTNCSQFIKCSSGKATIHSCSGDLIYNTKLKICDYPRKTPCDSVVSETVNKLQSLIPPIYIKPDLDKAYSHLGTGIVGELIVHPRSSFTLHCVYPENIWGPPKWNVTYTHGADMNLTKLTPEDLNKANLTVIAAKEEDSGIYKCVTSFGVQHAIEVKVKVVTCPAFNLEDDYEDVFYRPTPEGESRIMGTTAEFLCQNGSRINTQCMADGNWSRGIPSEEECSLKKRSKIWNCQSLELNEDPDMISERKNDEQIITFKCAGTKKLMGISFTRCTDDNVWSHVTQRKSLPSCINTF